MDRLVSFQLQCFPKCLLIVHRGPHSGMLSHAYFRLFRSSSLEDADQQLG